MIAVLTGDLVSSTRLAATSYQHTIEQLRDHLSRLQETTDCTFELYRGDGYQLVFTEADKAIVSLFAIKLFLNSQLNNISVNCTQALAYGEQTIISNTPGTSTGEAFVLSGRTLDTTRNGEFSVKIANTASQTAIDLMCNQLSYVLNRLSKKQADLLYQYIQSGFPIHQVLAEKNDTSRQNISERLKSAGGDLLAPFIQFINAQKDEAQ